MKEAKPGDVITIRLTKDTPQEVYDLINNIRRKGGNVNAEIVRALSQLAKESEEQIVVHIDGITREERICIEENKEMMALIRTIIKASLEKGY